MKNIKHFVLCSLVFTLLICALALAVNAETASVSNSDGSIRIDYDTDTQAMHIVNVNSEKIEFVPVTNTGDRTLQDFMDTYKTEVKSVTIDYFSRLNQYVSNTFFYGYTALESVNIAANQRIRMRSTGMFEGCTALKTVWVGDESNKKIGTADLTGILNNTSDSNTNNIIIARLFNGCSALEKVILPDGSTYNQLPATTFEGCTSLREVTIPANFLVIASDAFADCTALECINAEVGSVAYAFAEEKNLLPKEEYVSLWDQKPETATEPYFGYLWDWDITTSAKVSTNIKWEIHGNSLYLYIDEDYTGAYAENKIITSPVADDKSIALNSNSSLKNVHPFAVYNSTANSIYNIVIGDNIEGIDREAFALLTAVKTIELPESFTAINGSAFREMNSLSTVYVRGNTPKAGVIDLSGVTYIDFSGANTFSGLSSAKEYIFNPETEVKVDESDYLRNAFFNNTSLKTLDLSNMAIGGIGAYTFQNCTSLEEIYLPTSVSSYKSPSNDNASFKNNPALKAIYAPVGSPMHKYALANGYETTHTAEIFYGETAYASFTFYPELGRVEIVSYGASNDLYGSHGVTNYLAVYGDLVREIVFPARFQKIRPEEMFAGLKNLVSVCFAANERIYNKSGALFGDCESLTTVYFGAEEDMTVGVADFSAMNGHISDRPASFMKGAFGGCSSLKKVILPAFQNSGSEYLPKIYANSFEGCTSLASLTVPSTMTAIENGAFESCTSLCELNMNAPVSLIGEGTFAGGTQGLVVYCQSAADADSVNAILEKAGISTSSAFAFCGRGMEIVGYQVRTEGYNGLRTIFAFDETAPSGYKLLEYGSIVATEENWASYSASFGGENSILKYENGEFVTPLETIIKTPIYKDGKYSGNYRATENGSEFKVTVVKFSSEAQYKAEIINGGYEIWEKDGKYYVIFTNEDTYGLSSLSLYKYTLKMLEEGVVDLINDEKSPVWNMLLGCEKTEITTDNENVTAFLLADPINEGKFIALYATDSTSEEKITNSGISASMKYKISSSVFGKGILYSLPVIDNYWAEHIDEKLASLPEGKSFIIYTDTHYIASGTQNTRKLPDLISYVRANTGIKTVINLGDPYQKQNTIEEAEAVFRNALADDFYDVYGEDGLFVVGNHDANYTRWGKLKSQGAVEGVDGNGAFTVLLPDSKIYDATIKNIINKEGIVFDTEMLALADELTFPAIGVEDGIYYDSEQVKKEFIAWVHQHYYYDDAENGIRYIVYNSGNCGLVEYYVFSKLYEAIIPSQMRFIASALTNIPTDDMGEDYDVVFLSHMLGSNKDNTVASAPIYQLLSAFKAGKSYTYSFNKTGNAVWDAVVGIDGEITFDFTGNDFTGTVFTMSGHWHRDLSYVYETVGGSYLYNLPYEKYSDLSDDAVFYIGINNDNYSDVPDGSESAERDPVMTKGTDTENCFSIITITDDGEIVLTRIGAGVDRRFTYK